MAHNIYHSIFKQNEGACPICLRDENAYYFSSGDIFPYGEGFKCRKEGHEFSRYDMLKRMFQSSGIFGILNAFHSKIIMSTVFLTIGAQEVIPLNLPVGYEPSVTFFSVENFSQGNIFGPREIFYHDGKLFVATIPHYTENPRLGEKIECNITLYIKEKTECVWKQLLYESINDLSKGKENLSLFKMVTSLEMCMKNLLNKYLASHGLEKNIICLIGQTSWQKIVAEISIIISNLIGEEEGKKFKKAAKEEAFDKKVRGKRNDFAHSHPSRFATREVVTAFIISFELFWRLDRAFLALSEQENSKRQDDE